MEEDADMSKVTPIAPETPQTSPSLAERIAKRRTELRTELERMAVATERLRGAVAILEELAQDGLE